MLLLLLVVSLNAAHILEESHRLVQDRDSEMKQLFFTPQDPASESVGQPPAQTTDAGRAAAGQGSLAARRAI